MTDPQIVGTLVGLISIISALWKVYSGIGDMRRDYAVKFNELENADDRIELMANGARERAEHLTTRLQSQLDKTQVTVNSIERYLIKETSYEKRD